MSLTFDDADAVQLDRAVPELNKRHLRGTFFVIISKLTRLDDWRKAQRQGHEIGNHSLTHEHASALNPAAEELQVEDSKRFLDSNFGSDIRIFAYPYEESSPGLIFWVKRYNFAARGWRGSGELLYVHPEMDPDWYNLPSQPAYARYGFDVYKGWIDQAVSRGAWTTLQVHGIGDPSTGWEPIPDTIFVSLLDYLKSEQQRGLWVAPFGQVAAYLRAQKIVEKAVTHNVASGLRLNWDVPDSLPKGVMLRAQLRHSGRCRIFQLGRELRADKHGVYSVSFDARELVITGGL